MLDLKWISLLTLVLQNSLLVLVMRYSTTIITTHKYLPSTAVVMSEIIKLLISLFIYISSSHVKLSLNSIYNDILGKDSGWMKMSIPAILYFVQNNLQYHAVSMLDPATFQVTYQFKILTTALFSVLLLNRSLSSSKWISLILLTLGIGIVQLSNTNSHKHSNLSADSQVLGLLAVAFACILSGIAGVWFEKVLKGSKTSLFVRNIQLCIFSIIPGLIFGVFIIDGERVMKFGFFGGYTIWTWATILCQAVGGILVAIVVKYADNILKGFATSLSIVVSCIASYFIFDFKITFLFSLGVAIVLYATHLYGLPDEKKTELPYSIKGKA